MNYNHVTLIGRLAADPKKVSNGEGEATLFRVAVNRNYKDQDGNVPVDFIPCVAGGKVGEFIAQYGKKGRLVFLGGHIYTRQIEGKEDKKILTFSVKTREFKFLDPKKPEETSAEDDFPF